MYQIALNLSILSIKFIVILRLSAAQCAVNYFDLFLTKPFWQKLNHSLLIANKSCLKSHTLCYYLDIVGLGILFNQVVNYILFTKR